MADGIMLSDGRLADALETVEEYGFTVVRPRPGPQQIADRWLKSYDRDFAELEDAIRAGATFDDPRMILRHFTRRLAKALGVEHA